MFDKILSIIKLSIMVIVLGFIYFQFDNILNKLRPDVIIAPPQIIKIEDNALRIDFAASKKKVKELEKLLKDSDSKILAEVKKRNEKIDEIARITAELEQTRKLQQASAHVYLKGKPTDHHFIKIYMKASNGTEFPVAWAMFHPNQPDPTKLWKVGTYPVRFETDIIETEDTSGRYNRYVELNAVNDQMKETKGNRYPIKITDIKWAKNPITERHFFWWNPRLAFQGLFTNEVFAPSLDISLASYGRTKRDMDWRFIVPSIGLANKGDSSEAVLGFSPVQWNFGNIVPLVENAFLGPSFAWDTEGEMSFGAGLSIPF